MFRYSSLFELRSLSMCSELFFCSELCFDGVTCYLTNLQFCIEIPFTKLQVQNFIPLLENLLIYTRKF